MSEQPRVIKKYGNRRLYDTADSRYVNLERVAELVREGEPVSVVDAKTGEDLTRQVLTQIIVEDARAPGGGAPVEFLRDLIRASDAAQRDFLQWYLRGAAEAYRKLQEAWRERRAWPPSPAQWESWLRRWDPLSLFQSMVPGTGGDGEGHRAPPGTPDPGDEIRELQRRLAALERRLAKRED
ncbi:MAG TPA: polyhydroxyalkanoate synthesis regulator DNA-binding domain-containing protein [Thermoanaerobaculia bacterium]|nr:polyhydroxyalkanoate synthesis regulator DNA-binding domain-containing protein [Thermoanaerobaculia bacterium]